MQRFMSLTRYLIIVPIFGLLLASAVLFLFGGIALVGLVIDQLVAGFQGVVSGSGHSLPLEVEIVEYVHRFLIGTVLFITAVGFYQLFIGELDFPRWLKIDSTDELETNLVGVTVVVLGVNFMSFVFTKEAADLLRYGVGIAAVIAALALFIGLRTWSTTRSKAMERKFELLDKHGDDLLQIEERQESLEMRQ